MKQRRQEMRQMWCRDGVNPDMAMHSLAGSSKHGLPSLLGSMSHDDDKDLDDDKNYMGTSSSVSDLDEELDAAEDSLDMNFSGGEHDESANNHNQYINFHSSAMFNPTSTSPSSIDDISFNS